MVRAVRPTWFLAGDDGRFAGSGRLNARRREGWRDLWRGGASKLFTYTEPLESRRGREGMTWQLVVGDSGRYSG